MGIRYKVDKNGLVTSFQPFNEYVEPRKNQIVSSKKKDENLIKHENENQRCFFNGREDCIAINKTRDGDIESEVVESFIVLFKICLSNKSGTIDMEFPKGKYFSDGYCVFLEAKIKQDQYNVYRLYPKNGNKDIPKRYYPIIENNLLSPIVAGGVELEKDHLFGKGRIYKVADFKHNFYSFELEAVEIISHQEYNLSHSSHIKEGKYDHNVDPVVLAERHIDKLLVNMARIDMCFIEQADAYALAHQKGLSIERIAAERGISAKVVRRDMAIAGMPEEIRKAVNEGKCPLCVAEKIFEVFPDNDIRQSKAWEKCKNMKTTTMSAAIDALRADMNSQSLFPEVAQAKKENKRDYYKKTEAAAKEFQKWSEGFLAWEKKWGGTNIGFFLEGVKKTLGETEETFRLMERTAKSVLNNITLKKAVSGKLENRQKSNRFQ